MKALLVVGKIATYVAAGLTVAAAETNGQTQTWLLGAVFAVAMAMFGAGVYHVFTRLARGERVDREDQLASAVVAERVSVVEAKVEYLEGGKRVRFDLKLDKALLQEQIREEVKAQREAAEDVESRDYAQSHQPKE